LEDVWVLLISVLCVLVALLLLVSGTKVIGPDERGFYFRGERYVRMLEPGIWHVVPLVNSVIRMDMRERTITPLRSWNDVVAADGTYLSIVLRISYRVIDPEKAFWGDNSNSASDRILNTYQSQLLEIVGTVLYKSVSQLDSVEVRSDPERVAYLVEWDTQREVSRLGLEVTSLAIEKIDSGSPPGPFQVPKLIRPKDSPPWKVKLVMEDVEFHKPESPRQK
jgi:regulator of protease activity HflC (stomatin/prohibitin superfamily)